ncbi:hypothetical protein QL285_074810 [Trifolium repens]|nr:hypothetical protein QL285_074810 [Trifolium repens]
MDNFWKENSPSSPTNIFGSHNHHPNPLILHQNNHGITIIKLSMSSLEWAKQESSSKFHSPSNLCQNRSFLPLNPP